MRFQDPFLLGRRVEHAFVDRFEAVARSPANRTFHGLGAFPDVPASIADVIRLGHAVQVGLGGRAHGRSRGRLLFFNHLVDHAAEGRAHNIGRHGVVGLHLVAVDPCLVELAAQGFHRIHGPFRQNITDRVIDHRIADDGMPFFNGIAVNGGLGDATRKHRNLFHPQQGFLGPGNGIFRLGVDRRYESFIGNQDVTGNRPKQILGVAADIHVIVAVHADAPDNQQPGFFFPNVLEDFFERLPVQEGRANIRSFFLGDFAGNIQVRLVDFGQSAIDHFLMEFFLFLEAKDLAGLFVQDPGNAVKGGIVKIRIKGGNGLDRLVQRFPQGQPGFQSAEAVRAAVHGHDDFPAVHGLQVLHDKHVRIANPAQDPFGIAADHGILHGAHPQRAHNGQVVGIGIDVFGQHLPIATFQGSSFQGEIRLGTLFIHVVEVGIGNDLEPARDEGIVNLALTVELFFVVIFFRKPRFHLLEPFIVHFGGIDVAADDF